MALASGISWQICVWTGSKYPYLAPISVILCLQTTILKSIRFALSRILGTIFGVIFTVMLTSELPLKGWTIAFILLISTGISLLFGVNITSIHQIALSTLLILVFAPKLQDYGLYRLIDTVIGIIVILLIHTFIFPPNFTTIAGESLQNIKNMLVKKLEGLAVWLENGATNKDYFIAEMDGMVWSKLQDAFQDISKAENSMRFNPFRSKSSLELKLIKQKLTILRKEYTIIERFYEIILQWNEEKTMTKEEIQYWSSTFIFLGDALKNWTAEETLPVLDNSSIYHEHLKIDAMRFLQILKT